MFIVYCLSPCEEAPACAHIPFLMQSKQRMNVLLHSCCTFVCFSCIDVFLLLWRALNLHRRVCAFNHKIQQLKGFMYLFMYVRNSETCFTFQDVIYRIPRWYLRVCPPPTHPICHSVCPCMDFTTAESSSWHTYCREEEEVLQHVAFHTFSDLSERCRNFI